jgi:hypothetical protein
MRTRDASHPTEYFMKVGGHGLALFSVECVRWLTIVCAELVVSAISASRVWLFGLEMTVVGSAHSAGHTIGSTRGAREDDVIRPFEA